MNLFDALVIGLLVLAALAGARAGFFGPVLGLAGAILGFALALVVASVFREPLATIEQPTRALATLIGLGAFVLIGEALGATIGSQMSHGLRGTLLKPFDAIGGAVVGAAHVILFVWIVGGMLALGLAPALSASHRTPSPSS